MINPIDYSVPTNELTYIRPPFTLPKPKGRCRTFPLQAVNPCIVNASPPASVESGGAIATGISAIPLLAGLEITSVASGAVNQAAPTQGAKSWLDMHLPNILICGAVITLVIYIYSESRTTEEKKKAKL